MLKLAVGFCTMVAAYALLGDGELVLCASEVLFALCLVDAVEAAVAETTLDGCAVEYDGVFHVVAAAAEDGDYVVLAAWALVEAYDVHGLRADDGLLRVVE